MNPAFLSGVLTFIWTAHLGFRVAGIGGVWYMTGVVGLLAPRSSPLGPRSFHNLLVSSGMKWKEAFFGAQSCFLYTFMLFFHNISLVLMLFGFKCLCALCELL